MELQEDSQLYLFVALVCTGCAEREGQFPLGAVGQQGVEQVLRRENPAVDHASVRALSDRDPLEVGDDWGGVAQGELSVLADIRVEAADIHQVRLLAGFCLPVESQRFGPSAHEAVSDLNKHWSLGC